MLLFILFFGLAFGKLHIVNGTTVKSASKYPWMVSLFRYGEFICGATLISDNKVITAAHCTGGKDAPLEDFELQLFRNDLSATPEKEGAKIFNVIERWTPTNYDPKTYYNDISVLKFDGTTQVIPVLLEKNLKDVEGSKAIAIGWGATREGGPFSPLLQEVELPIVDLKKCNTIYQREKQYKVQPFQLCAGVKFKDACQGDSGGPLVKIINQKATLIGVISSGIGCAKNDSIGLYSRIAYYSGWINKILREQLLPDPQVEF